MCLGHSEGWKPPKVGVCRWGKCPQIRDSVCPARDTAIFRFQPAGHIQGPNEPISGPTDTVSGPHGSKQGQKASQKANSAQVGFVDQLGQRNLLGPLQRHRGRFLVILGHFGPVWGPTWGLPWARPLGRMEHFGGRDPGLLGPKGDCLSSQHHPGWRGPRLLWGPPRALRG